MKALLLLNGGAAVALLAFVSNIAKDSNRTAVVGAFGNALLSFGIGALVAAVVFVCAYFTELNYGNENEKIARGGMPTTYCMILLALIAFIVGIVFSRNAIIALG